MCPARGAHACCCCSSVSSCHHLQPRLDTCLERLQRGFAQAYGGSLLSAGPATTSLTAARWSRLKGQSPLRHITSRACPGSHPPQQRPPSATSCLPAVTSFLPGPMDLALPAMPPPPTHSAAPSSPRPATAFPSAPHSQPHRPPALRMTLLSPAPTQRGFSRGARHGCSGRACCIRTVRRTATVLQVVCTHECAHMQALCLLEGHHWLATMLWVVLRDDVSLVCSMCGSLLEARLGTLNCAKYHAPCTSVRTAAQICFPVLRSWAAAVGRKSPSGAQVGQLRLWCIVACPEAVLCQFTQSVML
jgi:hypothetical protein